jgi:hypothetical protein
MKDKIGEALEETFPASDTPSFVKAGAEKPGRSGKSHDGSSGPSARQSSEGSRRERNRSLDEDLARLDEAAAHERAK